MGLNSRAFTVDGKTYTAGIENGEVTEIILIDGGVDVNNVNINPGSNLFKELSEHDTVLEALSIDTTGQAGNVDETSLAGEEILDKKFKTSENNKETINPEDAATPIADGRLQYPSTAPPETMRYPYDIDIAQDHLTIKQYEYKRELVNTDKPGAKYNKNSVNESGPGGSVAGRDYSSLKTKPFGKFTGGVILPMPKVSDSNGAEWGKSDLNVLGIAAAGLAGGMINATINPKDTLGQVRDNVFGGVTTKGDNAALNQQNLIQGLLTKNEDITFNKETDQSNILQETGAAGMAIGASKLAGAAGIDISADELLARSTGSILNPNAELLFQGPVLRDFGFTFLMVARSEAEAKMIRRIIRFFKIGAAPIDLGGPALLRTPNVFQLEYKAGKNSLETVNKFNEMALRTITVDYAPDGFWTAYQDSHPVAVRMMLQFSELRPIYRQEHEVTDEDSVGY
jgi:hypothetical protein